MSHTTILKAPEFKSLDVIEAVCQRLGWKLHKNKKTYKTYQENAACAHAISIPGCTYEVGITKTKKGLYEFHYDVNAFDINLSKAIGGIHASTITQNYAAEETIMLAEAQGFNVGRRFNPQTHCIEIFQHA